MKRVSLMLALLLAGCAATPREQLPPVEWHSEADALQILQRRAERVQSVSAQGLMTMRRSDGQSVRLDVALVGDANRRMRLRAWKLGRAVFDMTMNADGVFMLLPDDPSIRQRVRAGQIDIRGLADSWDLFNGRFFARDDLSVRDTGRTLVYSATIDGARVDCEVDRKALVPRRYIMSDPSGAKRFTLALSDYRQHVDIPFAHKYVATSEFGEILISLHDVELNTELAATAFVPPRRAEQLK